VQNLNILRNGGLETGLFSRRNDHFGTVSQEITSTGDESFLHFYQLSALSAHLDRPGSRNHWTSETGGRGEETVATFNNI